MPRSARNEYMSGAAALAIPKRAKNVMLTNNTIRRPFLKTNLNLSKTIVQRAPIGEVGQKQCANSDADKIRHSCVAGQRSPITNQIEL